MTVRKLITGQRHGSVLILMEIEKRNSQGCFDVIVFCYVCNMPKRMPKKTFGGAQLTQDCGCKRKIRWMRKKHGYLQTLPVRDGRTYTGGGYRAGVLKRIR